MIEVRRRKKGIVYRAKRERDGGLERSFSNENAARLQDALWGRWGARVPHLADVEPKVPVALRARLLSKETRELDDQLLAELLVHHPAADGLIIGAAGLTVGEYIHDVFFPLWAANDLPGGDSKRPLAQHTVDEMWRMLQLVVYEIERRLDEQGAPRVDEEGKPVLQAGVGAFAWYAMGDVRPRHVLALDERVKKLGIGTEVWRKVRGFLFQVFQHAALDPPRSGVAPELRNPVELVRAPARRTRKRRRAYLPTTVEELRIDFLELAALAGAGRRRSRGHPLETPGGVPVPQTALFALQSADFIELGAYAGLRPGEWRALHERVLDPGQPGYLYVDQRWQRGVGVVPGTKSSAYPEKWALMLGPLAQTVERLVAAAGPSGLLLPRPGTDRPWNDHEYRKWRRDYFQPIARARGLDPSRQDPYSTRHAYSTMRIAAGHRRPYIVDSMGSSLAVSTYNDVQKELERRGLAGSYKIDDAIFEARATALADLHDRLRRRGIPPLDHPSFELSEPAAADENADVALRPSYR